jgi:hypothetical protein
MKAAVRLCDMRIVEVKVVQQAAPGRRLVVKAHFPASQVAQVGHMKAVLQAGDAAVVGKSIQRMDNIMLSQIADAKVVFLLNMEICF